mgnify:CR=1 FL=1
MRDPDTYGLYIAAIDELKERVPIWKREEGEWVRGNVPS